MRKIALAAAASAALLGLFVAEASAKSTFRLIGVQRCMGGCNVQLSYQNRWPSPQQQQQNTSVTFTGYAGGKSFSLGTLSMGLAGNLTLQINYARAGVKAGDSLTVYGRWAGGHGWGTGSKSAGSLILP
ncbi:MAG: hypothetical protein H6707_00320 [Deltaproteobacteria bacterium]|nr:hypothetical protein [Deltaproteobacteria bacterium]